MSKTYEQIVHREIQMSVKHVKDDQCSLIKGMQIKTIPKYYFLPMRPAEIQKYDNYIGKAMKQQVL